MQCITRAANVKVRRRRRAARAQVQDKVGFVVNNLSASNLEAKARELAGVLEAAMYPWFANYMVVKRAAQEPNFHGIYLQARARARSPNPDPPKLKPSPHPGRVRRPDSAPAGL